MNDNSQEFLRLYNDIDALLQDRYNDYDRNRSMIMRYCQELQSSTNPQLYDRGRILNSLRQLRNALIHDFDMNRDQLFFISDKTISFLKNELEHLQNPKRAIDIGTHFDILTYGTYDTEIYPLLYKMLQKGFMQLPIVDKNGVLLGIFSPNVLLKYAADHPGLLNKQSKIDQVRDYIPLNQHFSEFYEFVKNDETVQNISKLFDSYTQRGKKLVVVFVTKNGKNDEPINAIITPYDVVKTIS